MKLTLRYFICMALLLMVFQVQAQVQFSISTAAKEIGRKDELQVDYVISGIGNVLNFQPPDFENWQLIAGPIITSQDITINKVNGIVTRYKYILSPKLTGKLKIPATFVEINNKAVYCSELNVTVKKQDHVNGVSIPANSISFQGDPTINSKDEDDYAKDYILKPGEDAAKKIRDNLFVKAMPSKRKVYVGEPVLVEYKLYTRLKSVSRMVKQPTFNGCSVVEMTTDAVGAAEMLNGRKFTSYIIRKVQLIPLQQGKLDIGQASLENDITFVTNASDYRSLFYDQPAGNTQTVTLSSEPFSIDVVPLPKEATNHAIGSFAITTKLKKDTSAANESNALVVTISGSGNFRSLKEPEINWAGNIYHFDATETDELEKLSFPSTGKKVFEIPFEVTTEGKVEIPAVALSFFDPIKEKVQTVSSKPLLLVVTQAVKASVKQSTDSAENAGFNIKALLYLIPLAFVLGGILIWQRSRKTVPPPKTVTEAEQGITLTKEIDPQERYNELLLVQGDADFYIKAGKFAKEMIQSGKGDRDLLAEVLQDCNAMLYTPLPTTSKKETLDKLQRSIA